MDTATIRPIIAIPVITIEISTAIMDFVFINSDPSV